MVAATIPARSQAAPVLSAAQANARAAEHFLIVRLGRRLFFTSCCGLFPYFPGCTPETCGFQAALWDGHGFHSLHLRTPGLVRAFALWILLAILAICAVRLRRFTLSVATAALALGAALIVSPHGVVRGIGQLEATAIDVGQGDSLLVVTPDGKALLIDAGGLAGASPDTNFDMGEDVVSPVLWSRGIRA